MNIDPAFETNAQLAHAGEPGMGSLDHPAMTPQTILVLDPFAGDARTMPVAASDCDNGRYRRPCQHAACSASTSVALACLSPTAGHRPIREENRVVPVGARHAEGQGNTVTVGNQVALAAELAAIGRVGPCVCAPWGGGTQAASRLARLRSSLSTRRSSASRT